MVGSKTFPLNYTHKHKRKNKKGGAKTPPSIGNGGPKHTQKHRKNKTRGSQSSPPIGIGTPNCAQKHREKTKKGSRSSPFVGNGRPSCIYKHMKKQKKRKSGGAKAFLLLAIVESETPPPSYS
jgi:hypothetical protein